MKKTFVLIMLVILCVARNAIAAPTVSSYFGTMGHGQSITISGSAFGTKSTAGPLVWDNFEDGTVGQPIGGTAPVVRNISGSWVWGNTDNGGPLFSSSVTRTNSTRSSVHSYADDYSNGLLVSTQKPSYFFSFWWYFHPVSSWSRNTKPFMLSRDTGDNYPTAYIGFGDLSDPGLRTELQDNGGAIDTTSWGSTNIQTVANRWIRFDVWLVQSSVNVKDGKFQGWVHDPVGGSPVRLDVQVNPAKTRTTSNTWGTLFVQTYSSIDTGSDQTIYIDDFYLDSTQSRVEICNGSTWANRTFCEIQIPTAWSASAITATVNRGTFGASANAYLYVVDSTGAANSSGLPITFGGGGGDSAPPYASQWSPAKSSTGVLIGNRTISFHIQDASSNVLSTGGTVNIEGVNYTCSSGLTCTGSGTSNMTVTRTMGQDWAYSQTVNISTSGFQDSAGNTMATDTWSYVTEADVPDPLAITTGTPLTTRTAGTSFSQTLAATGGTTPYTWSLLSGTLPGGTTLSSGGVFSGTPTTAGAYSFTIRATDAVSATDDQAYTMTVNAAAPGGQTTVNVPADLGTVADTFINSGDPTDNLSDETYMVVYQWPSSTVANRILMNITADLPDNVTIISSRLYLYMSGHLYSGGTDPMQVFAYRVSGDPTNIATVTWNNFTGTLETYSAVANVTLVPGWVSWDITAMSTWAYNNSSTLYLALDGGNYSIEDTNRIFEPIEAAAFRPYAIITYMQNVGGPPAPSISAPGKMRVVKLIGVVK